MSFEPHPGKSGYNCYCIPNEQGKYDCNCSPDSITLNMEKINKQYPVVNPDVRWKDKTLIQKIYPGHEIPNERGFSDAEKLNEILRKNMGDLEALNKVLLDIDPKMTLTNKSVQELIKRLEGGGQIKPHNYVLKVHGQGGGTKKSRRKSRKPRKKSRRKSKIKNKSKRKPRRKSRKKSSKKTRRCR